MIHFMQGYVYIIFSPKKNTQKKEHHQMFGGKNKRQKKTSVIILCTASRLLLAMRQLRFLGGIYIYLTVVIVTWCKLSVLWMKIAFSKTHFQK